MAVTVAGAAVKGAETRRRGASSGKGPRDRRGGGGWGGEGTTRGPGRGGR